MDSTIKPVADIFERRLFRIPDYQRGYSWEKKHLQEFWDDLNRIEGNRNYYTGLLMLQKIEAKEDKSNKWDQDKWLIDDSGYTVYYIVDGQQRLTSIIILMQAILNRINDNDELAYSKKENIREKYIKRSSGSHNSYIFGYEFNDPSYNYLKIKVFENKLNTFNETMTIYTRNIEFARSFFEEMVENMSYGKLENLFKKLTLRLHFNVYEIKDDLDVFVTFETTNLRGKTLSKLELLKNRLIYLSTIIPNNGIQESEKSIFESKRISLRKRINEGWKTIYEYLGKNERNQLNDDDFLRNHYYMYYGYDTETANLFADLLLENVFTAKKAGEGNLAIQDIEEYVDSISQSAVEWFKIKNPLHSYTLDNLQLEYSLAEWLSKINRLDFSPFYPSILALLLLKTSDNSLREVLKLMERYIYLVMRVSKRKSGTGKNLFYAKAHLIFEKKIDAFGLTTEIKSRIDNPKLGHDKTMVRFKKFLQESFNGADENKFGYYGWNGLRYFLYEYEIYLQKDESKKVDWESLIKKNTIEHIYPQNDKRIYWSERFRSLSQEQKNVVANSLGNLLLLTNPKNASQSNHDFDYKKKHEQGKNPTMPVYAGYFKGSYSEIEVSGNVEWTTKEILERGIKMLSFMEQRWEINIGDDSKKRELLFLDLIQ